LETGAPVAPVSIIGTEHVRRGWRIRPRKVRLRVGRPLRFPTVTEPSRKLAAGMTRRIWACVSLQWEWLGGESDRVEIDSRAPVAAHETSNPAGAVRAA
jgi:hypothetical protein